jgi:hypothetical protein
MSEHEKWRCKECDHVCTNATMLTAPNPFNSEWVIHGCPECKAVDQLVAACAAEGCYADASCGCTHKDGVYRHTCHRHADWIAHP